MSADKWLSDCSADYFISLIRTIREEDGGKPDPALAIHYMHELALERPIDGLVEFTESFDERDAGTILTAAALCRGVEQVAKLAVKQWAAERGGETRLTDVIIHDVACQRTVPDVAVFVRECRRAGEHELIKKTLEVFTGTNSGRKDDDKVQLYIMLRDNGCNEEAADLLRQVLTLIEPGSARGSDATPAKAYDNLLAALQHFSPAERIVEEWIDTQLRSPRQTPKTRNTVRSIVAELIANLTDGSDSLVEHVGKRLSEHDIAEICSQLTKKSKKSPQCAAIRKHAASRRDMDDLARIVIAWYHSPALTQTTEDLLADIVAAGPRSPEELDHLSSALPVSDAARAECSRLLWIAAARHTHGRSGPELVYLLSRVERSRDHRRSVQAIARNLAAEALKNGRGGAPFVECVKELRRAGFAHVVFLALKELADPSFDRVEKGAGEVIAEIAARLYGEGLERDGWDLLERFLENEQRVIPQDLPVIVGRLPDTNQMPEGDRLLLLRATVGRWSGAGRREEAIAELRGRGFGDEAAQVILSLR